ncbi:MAG: hypothetical protein IJ242_10175 [Clostridia bacterium]|nr:hypothetical protein [Clostridia bacterium]
MKKIISLILTAMFLITFTAGAFAESVIGYTPEDVVQAMMERDESAETAQEQLVLATHSLVEQLVYVTSLNANEEQINTLKGILEDIEDVRDNTEITQSASLATGSIGIIRTLLVLARESDPNGVHADLLQNIIDSHNANDDAVETADEQTVNAFFTAIRLTALVVEESCNSQEQIDEIEAGLGQLAEEIEAAENIDAQLVVATKWLRKLLGAFAKLHNPSCADDINSQMEGTENYIVSEELSPIQSASQYVVASVYAISIFTGYMTLN